MFTELEVKIRLHFAEIKCQWTISKMIQPKLVECQVSEKLSNRMSKFDNERPSQYLNLEYLHISAIINNSKTCGVKATMIFWQQNRDAYTSPYYTDRKKFNACLLGLELKIYMLKNYPLTQVCLFYCLNLKSKSDLRSWKHRCPKVKWINVHINTRLLGSNRISKNGEMGPFQIREFKRICLFAQIGLLHSNGVNWAL